LITLKNVRNRKAGYHGIYRIGIRQNILGLIEKIRDSTFVYTNDPNEIKRIKDHMGLTVKGNNY